MGVVSMVINLDILTVHWLVPDRWTDKPTDTLSQYVPH